ncbi:DUF1638 domain-containing protein [Myxococcota bacterium]|nr:DUF1638 domain-containing protein [Myxococcota bacterium]
MPAEVKLFLCEHFVAEGRAALETAHLAGLSVELLARPCDTSPKVHEALSLSADRALAVEGRGGVLVGGGCLAGFDRRAHVHPRLSILGPSTCFELVAPQALVDRLLSEGAYLATSGWLKDWRARLAAQGLTPELAPSIFRESAQRIVLLDTGVEPDAERWLAELAGFVGLPSEIVPVGLEHLLSKLLAAAWKTRSSQLAETREQLQTVRRRAADATAISELMRRAGGTLDEAEIVHALMTLARELTASERAMWLPFAHEEPGHPVSDPDQPLTKELADELVRATTTASLSASGHIVVRIAGPDGTLGVLGLTSPPFSEAAPRYLSAVGLLALAVQPLLGNARSLHGLIRLCAWCRKIGEPDGRWRTVEEYVRDHSTASFTHGICPTCAQQLEAQSTSDLGDSPDSHSH